MLVLTILVLRRIAGKVFTAGHPADRQGTVMGRGLAGAAAGMTAANCDSIRH